ncbi:hypothetical protein AMR72_00775 [Flavobacterium psychrophilum]|nr:hypothetical protein AMR72_00775 [Flavobacterium psychrophilum]AOE51182.1 hypothetical protein ALW18_00775 [Flavobacterium psychrophilum]
MKQDYTLATDTKEISFDIRPETLSILQSMRKPVDLLKKAGQLGLKGVTTFLVVSSVFSIVNIVFLIYAVLLSFLTVNTSLYAPLAIAVFGFIFVFLAIKITYSYIFINILKSIYIDCQPIIKRFCFSLVDKAVELLSKRKGNDALKLKSTDVHTIFDNSLKIIPPFAKKTLWLLLKKIPFVKFINVDIAPVIISGDKTEASRLLFIKTDDYIIQDIFGSNTLNWLFWLLPLNIIVQIAMLIVL